jgi:hypothetical protein
MNRTKWACPVFSVDPEADKGELAGVKVFCLARVSQDNP